MKFLLLAPVFGVAAALLASCKPRSFNETGDGAQTVALSPSDTSRSVRCDLRPQGASARKATFRGKAIEYFSSDEIGYGSDDWWNENKPWLSNSILDTALLGYDGFKGTGRNFSVAQPVNARVVAVDVRNIGGTMHYHYFSNGTATSPMENWSSTKSLAMLMAAHTLRREAGVGASSTVFKAQSGGSTTGWVGDNVTEVARSSSNPHSVWFKSITGAQGAHNFARNWLEPTAKFGGGYGAGPANLGNWFSDENTSPRKQIPRAGTWNQVSDNTLMPITMVEFWKRLAVNAADPVTWLKKSADYAGPLKGAAQRKQDFFGNSTTFSLTDTDLKVLMYGSMNSKANGGLSLGANGDDEHVSAFGGKARLDSISQGKWRFFGKTGGGIGVRAGRKREEIILGGAFCMPAGSSAEPQGRLIAFFINVQAAGDGWGPNLTVLTNLASALVPKVTGGRNLWEQGASEGLSLTERSSDGAQDVDVVPLGGQADNPSVATELKAQPIDSSSPSLQNSGGKQDKKCTVPIGTVIEYADRESSAGGHMRLKRRSALKVCPQMPSDVYVFSPHWTFKDKN